MKRTAIAFAGLAAVLFFAPVNAAYACGSDSACKVGKCSSGTCGSCGSDSDCKGGKCSSGKCSNRDDYTKG